MDRLLCSLSLDSISSHLWQTFVSPRVSEISHLVPSAHCHYIAGSKNPADSASRGITSELMESKLWWSGSDFLSENSESLFERLSCPDLSQCPERRKSAFVVHKEIIVEFNLISQCSSFHRLRRVMAWMVRFISNSRSRASKLPTVNSTFVLLANEILEAKILFTKLTQMCYFREEYKCLSLKKP